MPDVSGIALMPTTGGLVAPLNGVQVSAYKQSRFAGIPAQNAAPPAGAPDAGPVVSGAAFGGPGAWILTVPTIEPYYIQQVFAGQTVWTEVVPGPQGLQGPPGAASSAPSGAAGGQLSGNYPNPNVANAVLTDAHIAAAAGIATSKLAGPFVGSPQAIKAYRPAANAFPTAAVAYGLVDGVNLIIPFTAPPSGNVLVRLSAFAFIGGAAASTYAWQLWESGAAMAGFAAGDITNTVLNAANGHQARCRADFYLTGLVAGSAHTIQWAHSGSTAGVDGMAYGPGYGPALMEVWNA